MHHQISAVVKGPHRARGGKGVVHHQQRFAVGRDGGDPVKVSDPQGGVRDHFDHDQSGLWPHRCAYVLCLAGINKGASDPQPGQVLGQQTQAATIELVTGDDVVARFEQPQQDR